MIRVLVGLTYMAEIKVDVTVFMSQATHAPWIKRINAKIGN